MSSKYSAPSSVCTYLWTSSRTRSKMESLTMSTDLANWRSWAANVLVTFELIEGAPSRGRRPRPPGSEGRHEPPGWLGLVPHLNVRRLAAQRATPNVWHRFGTGRRRSLGSDGEAERRPFAFR